jgi:cysteine desulfurase
MAVYLDHNATSPLRPEVKLEMLKWIEGPRNASSIHSYGRTARAAIEGARRVVGEALGTRPDSVVFVSSATEGNALALKGVQAAGHIVSAIEHDAVLKNVNTSTAIVCPVDEHGVVNLSVLADLLKAQPTPTMVSLMWVNNETGVVQPIEEVAQLVSALGGLLHVDAVQAAGRVPLHMRGIHALTLSAHKLGGPQGVGALICSRGIMPIIAGGGQERGARAGTENVAGIMGFAAALGAAIHDIPRLVAQAKWRDAMEAGLGAKVAGAATLRVGNTSCLIHPSISAELMLMKLDLAGVAVSSGAACSSGKVKSSHVLRAMGYDEATASRAIRVSMGWNSREADLAAFVAAWRAESVLS